MNIVAYLDHAAATPLSERAFEAMRPYLSDRFFNPSSPYAPAVEVRREYEAAKNRIAQAVGAKGDELVITAGATESINLAFAANDGHVVVPAIEHHAVLAAARKKDHTLVAVDPRGRVDATAIASALRPDTVLVSVALANNEIGTIQPLREIAQLVKNERISRQNAGNQTPLYLHSDISQGIGHIPVNMARLGVDMATLNSGKIYGPKQVGALWVSAHVLLKPIIVGGGQERGLRSGTENVAGVIGFAEAISAAVGRQPQGAGRIQEMRDSLQKAILNAFPQAVVSGHKSHRLPGHLHVAFPGIDAERMVFALEARGVMVATGSACAANSGTRSHVLKAIGLSDDLADGSLRITLGALNTNENIQKAGTIIIEELTKEYARINR